MSGTKDPKSSDTASVEYVKLADTWQLRFDIPVDPTSEEIAREFAISWTELLEAQKLTSVVSSTSNPKHIHIQACAVPDPEDHWTEDIEQVVEILRNLSKKSKPDVETEVMEVEPDEWQGFRLWITFDRKEAEKFFGHKKTRRRFGTRVFKRIYSGR